MCGIAGYVIRDHVPDPTILRSAERALIHRGPDDGGIVRLPLRVGGGEAGLANRRLAILDLSDCGHQPMRDPLTGNWIAYNGEVFNFQEVREELEAEGLQFESHSDTEVVLKAYGQWGERCLDRFQGMFAFAIWDESRQQLFMARDRLGIKPLYYYRRGDDIFFASEVRALLATGMVPRKISRGGLMNYITFGSVCDPDTLIEGVFSVPPASHLIWKDGDCAIAEYWDIADAAQHSRGRIDSMSDEELFGELRSRLRQALSLPLVSDVPVSVFLSGGIDSAALVAMLADVSPHTLHTFSIIFAEENFSEARYSRLVADQFQTDHHEILLHPRVFLDTIPEAITAMDQPSLDGINSYIISREVRAAGFKVALSGLGSDELFAGYNLFQNVPRLENFEAYMRFLPRAVRTALGSAMRFIPGHPMRVEKLSSFVASGRYGVGPYVLARSLFSIRQHQALLRNWTSASYKTAIRAVEKWNDRTHDLDPINRVSYLELHSYLVNTLLRDADSMSMAHSIEVRVPFLDHKLMEFVFSIPGVRKIDSKIPKRLLTKSLKKILPDEVVHRPKRGFTLPFEEWLRKDAFKSVNDMFSSWEHSVIAEYVDADAAREVWTAFLDGRTTWSRVWALYVLQRWAQVYLEQGDAVSNEVTKDAQSA